VTVIWDAAPLTALGDYRDPRHAAVRAVRRQERGHAIVSAQVTAEVDYLIGSRFGAGSADGFLRDLAAGVFRVECLEPHEYELVVQLNERYRSLRLGLADLSTAVLARRFDKRRIFTFDERQFRAVEPLQGGRFILLPADA
jgi:predicted nucleic acid-binding protein